MAKKRDSRLKKSRQKHLSLPLIFVFLGLIILFYIIYIYKNPSGKTNYTLTAYPTLAPTITPTLNPIDNVDNYIIYKIPNGWTKSVNNLNYVLLKSPNFRYNSTEGKDQGLEIAITRNKYTSSLDLKDYLLEDANNHRYSNFQVNPAVIGGTQGFSFTPINDGIGYDPNFPNYAVLKDGYIYNISFFGVNGSGLEKDVSEFLSSIKLIK